MNTELGSSIKKAGDILKKGNLVAIPTETVYGLAGNGLNTNAIRKIYEAKNRPFFNPLILHISSLKELEKYSLDKNKHLNHLANLYWPGPLTILLQKTNLVPDLVTAGSDKVAIRVPNHPLTKKLLDELPFPLVAPSANPFGMISPTSASHVLKQMNGKLPYILDGGSTSIGLESTIVELYGDSLMIHRQGGLSEAQLIKDGFKIIPRTTNTIESSGQLASHYSPRKPFHLISDIKAFSAKHPTKSIAYLTFGEFTPVDNVTIYWLSKTRDLTEAATNLFNLMHKMDEANHDLLATSLVPNNGIGIAINERLKKATFKTTNEALG